MDRRNFLKRAGLTSAAAVIPFTAVKGVTVVRQTPKSFIERSKYLAYTADDYMKCKLILLDTQKRRIWAPPISKVTFKQDPLRVGMQVRHPNVPGGLELWGTQFCDKEGRMLFTPRPFHKVIHTTTGNIFQYTYHLSLD